MSPSSSARALKGIWSGVAALLLLSAFPAFGSTITVVNTADSGPGSLRAAIASAASGDTIDFSLVVYPATISLSTPLTLGPSLTISGPGASNLAISGEDSVVVFIINAGAVATLSGVTITRGSSLLGGGIFNAGTLTLTDCTVSGNSQGTQLGGGIFNNAGTLTLSNSTVSGNSAGHSGFGGGIFNTSFGRLTLTNSTVSDNSADRGGGVFIDSGGATLTNSTVSGNSARIVGGILNGDTFVGASGGLLTLTNSTVSVNVGGGVSNADRMTLTNSTVSNNVGVGVSNGSGPFGLMTLTTSTVSGNTGVGILNSAFAEVTKSTVSGNSASAQSGGIVSSGTLTMTNSTVSGNVGGGILSTGDLTVTNSTVSGNLAGAGIFANFSSLGMKNSIVANHTGGNCGGNANALFFSHGYNLSDDATCSFFFKQTTDLNSTPAGLDPGGLKPNGGPTETIALLPTSAAVDAIPVSSCTDVSGNAVTTDQRGVPRPQGPACDIGAFEFFASSFQIEAVETFLIIDSVQSLPLPPGTQQGLIAPLRAAVDSLNRGDAKPAVNQLGAFINQVDAQMHSGVLTPQQASALTTQAQGVIQSLGGLS